jgi:1-deoxy-D-xylulose 5-phosphate reductoisomerase
VNIVLSPGFAGKNKNTLSRNLTDTNQEGLLEDIPKNSLRHVELSDALKHPKLSMGRKITIDSAVW